MKSLFISLLFLFSIQSSFSQGLNGEINFNNSFGQFTLATTNVNEYTYLARWESSNGSFFNPILLTKSDTTENIIWEIAVNTFGADLLWIDKIIPEGDTSIYVSGNGQPSCDLAFDCFAYIQKYDSSGVLQWTKEIEFPSCYSGKLSGVTFNPTGGLFYNYSDSAISKIYDLLPSGNISDSLIIPIKEISEIIQLSNSNFVVSKMDSLFSLDGTGNIISQKRFTSNIANIINLNDSIFILTNDSIFICDQNLFVLDNESLSGYSNYSRLKISSNQLKFISHSTNAQTVLILNHSLSLINQVSIPISISSTTKKDFSNYHFTAAIDYDLYRYQSIRLLDYSLHSANNASINTTDIGVIDIAPTQVFANPHFFAGVYYHKIWADVLIKNYGNNVLESCRINHYINTAICSHVMYFEEFTGLNLQPGDSMWISCGLIHNDLEFLPGPDTLTRNICVYTSHPNQKADLIVSNDEYCESIIVGFVGIEENENELINIFPNPASDYITIEFNSSSRKNIEIYSVSGQLLKKEEVISGSPFNISDLFSGYYLISVDSSFYPFIISR